MLIEKLEEIFREVFDDDSIVLTNDTNSKDIDDWDSLAHIQLISSIEESFGIKFTLEEAVASENVGEFIEIIEKKVNQ